jgi:hypothetical protein
METSNLWKMDLRRPDGFSRHWTLLVLLVFGSISFAQETLPPLVEGKAPQTHEELWAGYDPRAEPLDVEVLKEWEEDGGEWQNLVLSCTDFKDAAGEALPNWKGTRELRLVASDSLKTKVDGKDKRLKFGGSWSGSNPEFRNLRWIESK